jgi:hypothetical protein
LDYLLERGVRFGNNIGKVSANFGERSLGDALNAA